MKSWNKKKIIGIFITTAMVLVVLLAIGKPIRSPFPLSQKLDMPTSIDVCNSHIGIIDKQNTRLTICDQNGSILHIREIDKENSGESFNLVKTAETGYYYTTVISFPNSSYVKQEQIYFSNYSLNPFEESKLIYEKTYDESSKVFNPLLFSFAVTEENNDMCVVSKNNDTKSIDLISLKSNLGHKLFSWDVSNIKGGFSSASYDVRSGEIALLTNTGELYHSKIYGDFAKIPLDKFYFLTNCSWSNLGHIFCIDWKNNSLICIDPNKEIVISNIQDTSYFCTQSINDGSNIICGKENGIDIFQTSDFYEGTTDNIGPIGTYEKDLNYSFVLVALTLIVWIAIIYLVVFFLLLAIKAIKKIINAGKKEKLIRGSIIIAAVFAIVGVSCLYSSQFYKFAEETRLASVGAICKDITKNISTNWETYVNLPPEYEGKTDFNPENYIDSMGQGMTSTSKSYADFNQSLKMYGIIFTNDQYYPIIADAEDYNVYQYTPTGEIINSQLIEKLKNKISSNPECEVFEDENSRYLTAYQVFNINEENILGYIKVFSNTTDLQVKYQKLCISLVMTLLACGGALLLITIEIKAAIINSKRKKREKKQNGKHPEIWCVRQFGFWINFALCFDISISVLVAKEMLEANGVQGVDALAGLPSMFTELGLVLGYIIFGFLISKMFSRTLGIVGSVGSGLSFLCASFAVSINSFWLFCICKFFTFAFLSLPDAITMILPLRCTDETKRKFLFNEYFISAVSGTALGGMLCGYISEYVGNHVIYLICVFPCLIIMFVCIFNFSAKTKFINKNNAKNKQKHTSTFKMFFKPAIIALILFVIFPTLLAMNYQNILFPLFMNDAGVPKTYINNIVVFASIVVFAVNPAILKFSKNIDIWKVVVVSIVVCACIFLWFIFNNTVVWAILALIPLGAISRIIIPGINIMTSRQAKAANVDDESANNIINIVRYFIGAFPSPILSGIAVLGQAVACAIVGGICMISAGLFAITTRKSCLRKSDKV